jgi:diacylglycerol kinase
LLSEVVMPPLPTDSLPSAVVELPRAVDITAPLPEAEGPADAPRRPRHSWRDKFKFALRGLKFGIRGHSSFAVHFFFAAVVLAAAAMLIREPLEWCLLLGCIGLVLTAELFNSAVETLFRGLDDATKARVWPCLDIAAGAVLVASATAAVIGSIVFLRHLVVFFGS